MKRTLIDVSPSDMYLVGGLRGEFNGLDGLAESLLKEQQQPVILGPKSPELGGKHPVYDGNRRGHAALAKGIPTLLAMVVDHAPTPEELVEWQMVSDVHKCQLTAFERADGICRLRASHPGITNRALAERMDMDETLLCKYRCMERLGPEAYEAFKVGELNLTEMTKFAGANPQRQVEMLDRKRGGANRQELADLRDQPEADDPKSKSRRLICPVDAKVKVLITGPEMTLSEVLGSLGHAIRKIESAIRDGHDVKSFPTWLKTKSGEARAKPGRKKAVANGA